MSAFLPSPPPLPESCGFLGHKERVRDGDLNRTGLKKAGGSQAGGMGSSLDKATVTLVGSLKYCWAGMKHTPGGEDM